jgi:hypothetical protein
MRSLVRMAVVCTVVVKACLLFSQQAPPAETRLSTRLAIIFARAVVAHVFRPGRALWGFRNLQVWLDHGFTALRDAGEDDLGYGQLALRDSIQMGLIRGPRMVSAGNYVSLTGGHGDVDDRNYRGVLISLTP